KAAAARLGLSPSAVSHALSRLRDLFDDRLFVRRSHGLEPTTRALALQAKVKALLSSAEALLDVQREFDPAVAERVFTVAAPEYLTAQVAAPLVQRWTRRAPSLFLHYKHLAPRDAIRDIRRGEVDFGIGRFDDDVPVGLVRERLYEDSFCVVARRSHPRIRGRLSRAQYEAEGHALAGSMSEVTAQETATAPRMPNAAIVGSWTTALLIAAETDSLVTCHRRLAERFAGRLRLQVLDLPSRPSKFTVAVVRRDDRDPGVAWVLEQVREQFADG
ncbi:MAG: LysR family transcriptional regulator, partial [Proteobacteria bacterium]|nr:LysR family transcriptional regulator [Pseudomonadota bacterium]